MARTLKVFRTPIGFHDAYVASPSQKAALKAWGTGTNLFARGAAEQVTDAELIKEPMAHPGKVIKRARGSEAEHLASLAKARPPKGRKGLLDDSSNQSEPKAKKRPSRSVPRPDRANLTAAVEALTLQAEDAKTELKLLEEQQARLREEIERLRQKQQKASDRLESRVAAERRKYDAALERWRSA